MKYLESLFIHCYFYVSYIVRCSTLPLLLADSKASFDSLSGKFERLFLPHHSLSPRWRRHFL